MSQPLSRRQMLGTSVASFGVASTLSAELAAADANDNTNAVVEPQRSLPVAGEADVIVCGGGPAGISAAIAAARSGAKVRLFEFNGSLGGVWTNGMLSYVIDAGKPGFNAELARRLTEMEARIGEGNNYVYDVESMKVLLESLLAAEKVVYQLHTPVVAVEKDSAGRVTAVITESKSGRQAWRAKVVIDTTGDGDVGALAGCRWQFGHTQDCPCQPMSLMGVISADEKTLAEFSNLNRGDVKHRFRKEMLDAGIEPSYAKPTLWHMGGTVAFVMINHEYNVRPFDAAEVTAATVRARRELYEITAALRKAGGKWADVRLIATAEQIGIRDGRRIQGRYFVTVDDVKTGARHEDAVCRSNFCVDIHAESREKNRKAAYSAAGIKAKPFDIPLRALIAADVDGLMMAGRCISGDYFAHASYRVTGNAVAMGEAAGVAAALAARDNVLPHELKWTEVQTNLQAFRDAAA